MVIRISTSKLPSAHLLAQDRLKAPYFWRAGRLGKAVSILSTAATRAYVKLAKQGPRCRSPSYWSRFSKEAIVLGRSRATPYPGTSLSMVLFNASKLRFIDVHKICIRSLFNVSEYYFKCGARRNMALPGPKDVPPSHNKGNRESDAKDRYLECAFQVRFDPTNSSRCLYPPRRTTGGRGDGVSHLYDEDAVVSGRLKARGPNQVPPTK